MRGTGVGLLVVGLFAVVGSQFSQLLEMLRMERTNPTASFGSDEETPTRTSTYGPMTILKTLSWIVGLACTAVGWYQYKLSTKPQSRLLGRPPPAKWLLATEQRRQLLHCSSDKPEDTRRRKKND